MKLFKNSVGRPSNETLKKRRVIYVISAIAFVALVGVSIFFVKKQFFGEIGSKSKNAATACAQPYNLAACENEGYYGRAHGPAIQKLQEMLKEAGYHYGYVNGNYGSYTVDAVKRAQKAFGLQQTGQADYQLVEKLAPKYNYGYAIVTYNRNGGTGTILGTKNDKQFFMRTNTPISTAKLTKSGNTHVGWVATSTSRSGNTTYYYGCSSKNCTKPTMYTAAQKNSLGSSFVPYVFTPGEKVHSDTLNALDGVKATFTAYWCSSTGATYNKSNSSCSKGKASSTPSSVSVTYPRNITIRFVKNGSSTEDVSYPCTLKTKDSVCKIRTPKITAKSGFVALGWSTSKDAVKASISQNTDRNFKENTTLYAITRSTSQYAARFNKGTNVYSIGATNLSCYRFNGASSCSVKAPSIVPKSGYTVLGWSTVSNASTASIMPGDSINLTSSRDYYSIAKKGVKVYTATFYANGSSNTEKIVHQCVTTEPSCQIKTPYITAKSGFTVLGWNSYSTATSASYKQNATMTIHSNVSYYAITRSTNQYAARFNKGSNVSSIGASNLSCYRYNGASSCPVKAPSITAKSGYNALGWSLSSNSSSASYKVGSTINLTASRDYYTVTKAISHTYTATFYPNGSNGSTVIRSCTTTGTSCQVSTPGISAKSGFSVVGWGTYSSATSSVYSTYRTINLSRSLSFYAVTKSTLVATFVKGNNVSSIGATSRSCTRYNGAATCSITMPSIVAKNGYLVSGWSLYLGQTNGSYKAGSSVSINSSRYYYTAVYKKPNNAYYR